MGALIDGVIDTTLVVSSEATEDRVAYDATRAGESRLIFLGAVEEQP